jgi:hypothetical protein
MTESYAFIDENGNLVDQDALAMIHAIERHNIRQLILTTLRDRVAHFVRRHQALGVTAADYLIVILHVDDPNGAALAEVWMPGYDWSPIRTRGEIPIASGLCQRPPLQDMLRGTMASRELAAINGIAVLIMARGIITAFAASELS